MSTDKIMSSDKIQAGLDVYGAPEGYDALLLRQRRAESQEPVIHVCRDDARMARLADALGFFMPEAEILRLPAWDCLPYDRVSPNPELVAERVATLAELTTPTTGLRIVLTTVNALVQKVPPRTAFQGSALLLRKGGRADIEEVTRFLDSNGYNRTGTVMEPGEYAVRGGILDLFPSGESEPMRLDLFGDEIESIRRLDTGTQRSGAALDRLTLRPVGEVFLDQPSIERFRAQYRELFGNAAGEDPLYVSISAGRRHPGMEHWAGLFHDHMETLLDYLPGASVSLDAQAGEALAARLEMIDDHYEARRIPARISEGEVPYRPAPPRLLYLDQAGWDRMLAGGKRLNFSPFHKPDGASGYDAGGRAGRLFTEIRQAGENLFSAYGAHAETERGRGRQPMLAAWTRGSRERLVTLLRENRVAAEPVEDFYQFQKLKPGVVGVGILGLERGFTAEHLSITAEQDLLGERIARPPRRKRRADQFIADATQIEVGDLLVHQDHGIGRYDGLATIEVSGAPHDCLRMIYDGGDKLFVPVENIEILSRFGSETAGVALDKLGGASWQARKSKAKQRIADMAAALIRIAAERQTRDAPIMAPPEGTWDEFCSRFPYVETDDQSRAIADVLEDLAAGKPMDRLICGDVGFGKTEVALRAAFTVAISGVQVAVVVPTTLLARQHHRTFTARFAGMPVKVAQLSRMVTAKEAAAVKAGLANGSIDIVVGTHALLGKTIQFADLGLVIVDEEQH
ncbi:MAG: transcription-repair coupling factor, partial [Rubritepida sp.]|nr:transcription-repair coupling factor [Rubritepida sp.]